MWMRWTSANRVKGVRSGYKYEGGRWFKVVQRGDEKKEKAIPESQVPGDVLDDCLAAPDVVQARHVANLVMGRV